MKKLFAVVGLVLFALASQAQYDQKAKEYLDKVSNKYQSIDAFKASFTYSMESPAADVNDSFSGDIMVKGKDKIKLNLRDQIIYIDGTTQWNYLPEDKEVNIVEYDPEEMEFSPDKIYNLYKKGYKYIYIEPIQEGGKTYHVIDLVPEDRNKSFFKIKLFVEDKTSNIASWRIYEKSGNKYQYKINSFDSNSSISDSEFRFDKSKHKGVEVIDLR